MKRVKAEDPVAMREHGLNRYHAGDFKSGFEYVKRAAELGDGDAHHNLAVLYLRRGYDGGSDAKKGMHHMEQAAIAGHPDSRYNLASFDNHHGRVDRAIKHWTIAANLGHDLSLAELKLRYKSGVVSKEIFAGALRGHQAAVDATKSPQREAAEAAHQRRKAAKAARQRR